MAMEHAGEEPLLPEAVRDLPYSWDLGFVWPPETEESRENIAYARAVLEACLPPVPLTTPEPPPEVTLKFLGPDASWQIGRASCRERV